LEANQSTIINHQAKSEATPSIINRQSSIVNR